MNTPDPTQVKKTGPNPLTVAQIQVAALQQTVNLLTAELASALDRGREVEQQLVALTEEVEKLNDGKKDKPTVKANS